MKKPIIYLLCFCLVNGVAFAKTKHHKKHHISKSHHATHAIPRSHYQSRVLSTIPASQLDRNAIANQPKLYSYSALALDAKTNKILVSKNPNVKLPIASITKLMTAIVVLDSHVDLDDYVSISSSDVDTLRNTYSRLRIGMQLRRRDLLLLALMSSENRAAHALGRTTFPGGTSAFIKKMNQTAKTLGMVNTVFYDPTGLTNANRSTAEDLSRMVEAAYSYDLIREDTTTKSANVILGSNYTHRYINSDALVRSDTFPIEVSKTGFINEAGHCLVLYSIVSGEPIIMVFLNSNGKGGRLVDAIAVKNYVKGLV